MWKRSLRVAALLVLAAPPLSAAPPAPHVSVATIDDLTVPSAPFDTSADADRQVADAFVQARREHKRVLLDLGGNWCADCRIFAAVMALPEVHAFLDAHYVVVDVDIGRFTKNLQIPARYGITTRVGFPAILIVTPDGTLVDKGHVAALIDARAMTPQAIADWLASWAG